jgi:PAS domain S-box-containing protein
MKYKAFYCATFVILLCLISIFFQLSNNTYEVQYGLEQGSIEKIIQLDSDIDRELLQLHERVKNNYDDITTMIKQKDVYLERVEYLDMNINALALKQFFDEKALLIEEFKSVDSILHNSEIYILVGIDQLKYHIDKMQPNNDFTEILLLLKNEILLFTNNKNTKDSHDIDSLLIDIDSLSMYQSIKSHKLWDGIKRHAASIIIRTPRVNGLIQEVLSSKYRLLLNEQHQLSIEHQKVVKSRANIYKLCLFLTTLALLFYCLWIYIRINRYTHLLSELNATLEHKVDERNKELYESVSRRDELINCSPSIIYAMEAFGDFRTTYISGNVETKLGFTPDRMLKEKDFWLSRIHPDDRNRVLQTFNFLLKQGYMVVEYRMLDNVNNYQWIQDSAHLVRDEKDEPLEIIGSWADITELKQAAHDIQSQKEYSENLIQNQSNPTFVIDADHKVLSWNKACEELTGLKSENVLGTRNHWCGFYQEQRPCLADTVIDIDIDSKEASEIYINYTKSSLLDEGIHAQNWCTVANGEERFLSIDAAPIYDHKNNLVAVVENLRDMTTQKNLEDELLQARDEALNAAKFKSEFLANMSHEIRTPMNGVLGMLQLAKDFDLPDECQDYINTAHSSADALLEIINDILDFSKIEAGKLGIESVDFDLQEILDEVCALLSQRAVEKKIQLLSYIDNKIPGRIKGDPTRLRQIMLNLIGNAIKFTAKGEVVVRALTLISLSKQTTIKIEVNDTGIGIPEHIRASLFQAFTQADGSTTRKFGGTGLGLAISKQLVEMMGGTLTVDSEPGKGSSFFFTLSFDVVAQDKPDIKIDELNGLTVLVVDDNSTNRIIVCNYLNAWGMATEQTDDANLAFQLLTDRARQGKQFDLVALDMQMPGMDGLEFSKKMQLQEKLAEIPRILLTSSGKITSEVWQAAGINACLQKPYRREQLRMTLSSILNKNTEIQQKERKIEAKVISFKHSDSKILLVEDNLVNQKVALGLLRKIGLSADIASNGQIALEKIDAEKYDLVLMDCQMPVMSGYEATEIIRKNENDTNEHLTIIAMTANAMEGDREKCIAAGMDDYLPKPVKLDVLKEILEKWLDLNEKGKEREESDMNDQSINRNQKVILDENVLADLKDIMEDEFIEVLQLFLDESVSLMADVHAGFSEETDKLVRAIHTLKSSSRNVGAMHLGEMSEKIEALAKTGDIDSAKLLLDELQQIFIDTHALIKKYIEGGMQRIAV